MIVSSGMVEISRGYCAQSRQINRGIWVGGERIRIGDDALGMSLGTLDLKNGTQQTSWRKVY
jgi:hypothetical protein